MKKTTPYARRRARQGLPTDPSVLHVRHYLKSILQISGVKPFSEAEHQGTADHIMLKAHSHLHTLMHGQLPASDTEAHDYLAHIVGIAKIRTQDIGGPQATDVIADLNQAAQALQRARDRWHRMGKWGLDGPGLLTLPVALDHYEAILRASSPQQMEHAQTVRLDRLKAAA